LRPTPRNDHRSWWLRDEAFTSTVVQRPVVHLGEQRPLRVEGLVAAEVRVADDRVHDHLVALLVDSRPVAAEHHRQPVRGQPDPLLAPQVVVVERGGQQPHRDPVWARVGIGPLPHLEPAQRVVGIGPYGGGGEHEPTLPRGVGRSKITRLAA